MPNITLAAALSLLLWAATPLCMAAEPIIPNAGLWQVDGQVFLFDRAVPNLNKLVGMGPQKLQMHIDNMLRQNHARIASDGTAQLCVNAQQIASGNFVNDQGSGCKVSRGIHVGNVYIFQIQCAAPSGSGVTTVRLLDSTHWQATTQLILTIRGIAQQIDVKSQGTWLNEKCPAGM